MNKFKQKHKSVSNNKDIDLIMKECESYRKDLIWYCYQYFEFEPEDAEDCVQEAYLALYDNLQRGVEIKNYKAWLYKQPVEKP